MTEDLLQGETKRGKIIALAPDTIEAMRAMRYDEKKSVKEVCDFFHVSAGTVSKYCPAKPEEGSSEDPLIGTEEEIDSKVQKNILKTHGKHILEIAKEKDAELTHAGASVADFFREHNLNLDITRIPKDQVIEIIRGIGDYKSMDPKLKSTFDEWLSTKLSSSPPPAVGTGRVNFEDIKELMMLNFLGRMGQADSVPIVPKDDDRVEKLIIENDKLRQEFKDELEKNRQEMRDLVLEKRLQTMDDTHAETVSSLSGQLNDVLVKIEGLKTTLPALPAGAAPVQKTALDELTAAVTSINRIKGSLTSLGVIPAISGAPGVQAVDYTKADGSIDYFRYTVDKASEVAKPLLEAHFRQTPERKPVVETPPVPDRELTLEQAEAWYQQLLLKTDFTQSETNFLNSYSPVRARFFPAESPAPAVEPEVVPEPMGVLERMRRDEEQSAASLAGVL